ncbi:MAG TPA: hypothetical protein VNP04_21515 [Alphaproteobacteria bacterium]|nr:hypothetical protein [Alphaproteobacteria bacterium]
MAERACACLDHDAYDCFARRYSVPLDGMDVEAVEAAGGHCSCLCHDAEDDDLA